MEYNQREDSEQKGDLLVPHHPDHLPEGHVQEEINFKKTES